MGMGGQSHTPAATPTWDPVPIVKEAGWAPGPVWTGEENLAPPPPNGIWSPDRPARSESLYRLRYPGPQVVVPVLFWQIIIIIVSYTGVMISP